MSNNIIEIDVSAKFTLEVDMRNGAVKYTTSILEDITDQNALDLATGIHTSETLTKAYNALQGQTIKKIGDDRKEEELKGLIARIDAINGALANQLIKNLRTKRQESKLEIVREEE